MTTVVTHDGLTIKPKCGSYEDPEIWIQDASSSWHFVADSFTTYLRLAIVHLGIIGWQNAYTPVGLPPVTKQWMARFGKERRERDRQTMRLNKRELERERNHKGREKNKRDSIRKTKNEENL